MNLTPSEVLADANHVLQCARANLPLFEKKRMNACFFVRFERTIRDAESHLANARPAQLSAAEKALQAVYNDALARLAKDVARVHLAEIPTRASLADPAVRSAANRAGITPARLQAVGMLRDSLAKPVADNDAAPVLAAISEETARVREVAAVVLKKAPARLAEFAPRTKRKRRAAKRTGGG